MKLGKYQEILVLSVSMIFTMAAHAADTTVLAPIEVTPEKNSPPPVTPGAFSMGRDQLTTVPGSGGDPLRAVQTLPGIAVNDDASAAPAVRGSRPEDNRYLVDFLPTAYLFHFGGAVSVFNEQLVNRFTLYPAAFGAEYANTTGAVIDVALRDPVTDQLTTTLDVSFIKAGALIEGPVTDKQSFYLAGRFSYIDLLLKDVVDDGGDGVEFVQFPKFTDYQGKYVWKSGDRSHLRFQVTGASDKTKLNLSQDNEDILNEPDLVGTHLEDLDFSSQGLVWNHNHEDGQDLTLALGHMRQVSKSRAANAGQGDSTQNSFFAKARWIKPLTEEHQLMLGGTASHITADYSLDFKDPGCTEFDVDCEIAGSERLFSEADVDINALELFVEDTWFATDQFAITGGLALSGEDYLDKSFVEPRVRLEYALDSEWILSAGAGQYHQFPGFIVSEKVFGNPRLNHFNATHYVVGAEKALDQGWSLKTEIYYKQFKDLVTSHPVTRFSNEGKGRAYGLELLAKKALTQRWSGWLSVSLSDAERENTQTGETFKFEYDQPLIVNLVTEYQLNDHWKFGLKWWYHSGAPYTPITGGVSDPDIPGRFEPVYGKINSARLDDYHRLDLRADRQFGFKRVDLTGYVELINAYGHDNLAGFDYNQDYSRRKDVYQLPTILSFGVKARF